ncbi:MAG: nuclear transport factor 2 family protein [Chroococcidiopsidaceae cyanobacterium CP_BM_ER_R8_30]|nr:nuclear transport factor 2 family protein [Chroococcidiopsidaceae cyanobacterium CP_BM_ER_R8_30]
MNQNAQTWEDWFAEDVVFESPYAPRTPGRLEGKAAVCSFIKNALVQMQNLRFSNIRVYPTTNPNLVWAEFHGKAVAVATGRPYQQDYVLKLKRGKDRSFFTATTRTRWLRSMRGVVQKVCSKLSMHIIQRMQRKANMRKAA